jgi:hypothetical protein
MRVGTKLSVNFEAVLHLTEPEIRAMDALVCYGFEPFVKVFYEKFGEAYMRDHVGGLRTFFESIEKQIRPELHRMEEVQKVLKMEMASGGQLAKTIS